MWRDPWGYNNRIFEQIDKEFSDAEDMLNRMFRTVRESSAGIPETFPYYYGYQITMGPMESLALENLEMQDRRPKA